MNKFKKIIKILEEHNLNYNILKVDGDYKLQFTMDTRGITTGFSISANPGFGVEDTLPEKFAIKVLKEFIKVREEVKNSVGKKNDN